MKYQWGSCSCLITIEWSQWNCIVYISMSTWHKSLNNIATEDSNEVPEHEVVQRNEENPKEECILKKCLIQIVQLSYLITYTIIMERLIRNFLSSKVWTKPYQYFQNVRLWAYRKQSRLLLLRHIISKHNSTHNV